MNAVDDQAIINCNQKHLAGHSEFLPAGHAADLKLMEGHASPRLMRCVWMINESTQQKKQSQGQAWGWLEKRVTSHEGQKGG